MTAQINENEFISEEAATANPNLSSKARPDNQLKSWLIDYVGQKHDNEDDDVTVEMIVETIAKEFPEFLLAVAEENWIRGYRQAFIDIEVGEKICKDQIEAQPDDNEQT